MLRSSMVGSGLVLVLSASLAVAGNPVINEEYKFTPNDGVEFEFFGAVTALENGTIAMGLPNDDNILAENSGSVYLFDSTTGTQLFKLNADVLRFGARFGTAVAIDNAIVAVGTQDDDNGPLSGSAYLFDAITGTQLFKLLPNDGVAGDQFGSSIAIQSTAVVIGAKSDSDNGTNSGSAYLFDASTGLQAFKLLPDDGESGDGFGVSVAIGDNIIAVGAWLDDDNGTDAGAVYLFDATTGTQLFKLLPADGDSGDLFGESISIDNGIIAIGARIDGDNGAVSGSAYLFDATTGLQLTKILPSDGASNDQFGNSVSMHNGTLAVGAHQENANGSFSGSAYLFDVDTGDQIAKLIPSDGGLFHFFGTSIAVNNGTIIVGATGDDDNGSNSGSAYVFTAPGADCPSDLNGDGFADFLDISAFLTAFAQGCP